MPPEKQVRYFEWDYNEHVMIEYERDGVCNECGACCATRIQWTPADSEWYKTHIGVQPHPKNGETAKMSIPDCIITEVRIGDKSRYFHNIEITDIKERCSMLTGDNRCRIHLGKSLLSREWPMSPRHVTPFAECSYTFREIRRFTFEELGLDETGEVINA